MCGLAWQLAVSLSLYDLFTQRLESAALPDSLQSLRFGSVCNHNLQNVASLHRL